MKIFNKEKLKGIVKNIAKTASVVAMTIGYSTAVIASIIVEGSKNANMDRCSAGYYDVVRVITNSDMFDYDKKKTVGLIKRFGDDEYYKAIIDIIQSDMFDYDKINMIKLLG